MELWDLYDADEKPLDRTHRRGEPMERGTYHLGVDIWVITSDGRILLTLRSMEKDDCPGEWENTCGSVLAGETAPEGAARELSEETGITASPAELIPIGRRVGYDCIDYTYILKRDIRIEDIRFQPGETVAARLVTPDELDDMISAGVKVRPVAFRWPFARGRVKNEIEEG